MHSHSPHQHPDQPAWDSRERTPLPFLSADAFVSQTDKAALANVQRIPLLPHILRKFHEMAWDKISYVQNTADSVRCGPRQYATLHRMLQEACAVMHITEPELYVRNSEVMNAYTSGTNQTFIVLHSGLIQNMTDEEVLFVIGHECGHIKAGHVLYQEIGRMLLPMLEVVGQATLGLGQLAGAGLVAAFFEWMRQAEISCDRAGMLVCQSPRSSLSALMKMGSGSTRFDGEANLDAFLEQARQHADLRGGMEGLSKALLFILYNWQLTHPQVVYRAKALDEWERGGAYARILGGEYPRDMAGASQMGQRVTCPGCRKVFTAAVSFCPECGQSLQPVGGAAPAGAAPPVIVVACAGCGERLAPGTRFCARCGAAQAPAPA